MYSIVVEFAKESRPRRDPYVDDRYANRCLVTHFFKLILTSSARARRPPGIRIVVTGISRDTSWQVCLV